MLEKTELKLFDTHAHYNISPLKDDWRMYWDEAQKNGVKRSLIASADFETAQIALEISREYNYLYASLGLHPDAFLDLLKENELNSERIYQIDNLIDKQITTMKDWSVTHEKVRAIGEIGLDYYRIRERTDFLQVRDQQIKLLKKQILWAKDVGKTIIFHTRDTSLTEQISAYTDLISIIKEMAIEQKIIIHCASGSEQFISDAVALNAYVSFAGNLTYKNADNLRKLVSLIPDDKILIETDAPFLPPAAHRGKLCRPAYIAQTAAFLQYQFDKNLNQIYSNSLNAYNL